MTAQLIIDYLEKHANTQLPKKGIIAGQSVAEAYFRVNNINIHTRIKDIDIFIDEPYHLRNETKPIQVKFSEKKYKLISNDYELLVDSINNNYSIHCVEERDIFNYIYISNQSTKNNNLLNIIVDRFDINSVQIGINLKTKKLYVSEYFKEFVNNRQLKIVNYHSFPSSLMRIIDKKISSKNTYLNLDFEISYGLPLYINKIHRKGTFVLDKKYQKLKNIPESKPYLDIINHYFNISEESFFSDKDKYTNINISPETNYKVIFNGSSYYCSNFLNYYEEYCEKHKLFINIIDFILMDNIDEELLNKFSIQCKKIQTVHGIPFNFFYFKNDSLSKFIPYFSLNNILIPSDANYNGYYNIQEQILLKKFQIKENIVIDKNLMEYCKILNFNDKKTLDFFHKLKNKPIEDFKISQLRDFFNFIIHFDEYNYVFFKTYKLNKIFSHYTLFLKLYLLSKNKFKNSKDFFEHTYQFFNLFKNENLFLIGALETEKFSLKELEFAFFNLNIDNILKKIQDKSIKQKIIIPREYLELENYTIKQISDSFYLKHVGQCMNHCVGGYAHNLKRSDLFYFDIYDPNEVRITLEMQVIQKDKDIDLNIKQMRLKRNEQPTKEHFRNIYLFLKNLKPFFIKIKSQ